ncbi:Protein of unknown function [Paenibacillus catalpae]|uniref:Glycosyltransferase 61 catalytic domain-containing protein n=1 Tax=Paenibacillus catalpae TaxID=1045775 RepID=A0A1I1U7Q0_9BACL|nr:glycosyltransferase 61 family protein [Paenibacillus catalpae]SFD66852.1 Protein of unknown function [Paenibacillus catalpae]
MQLGINPYENNSYYKVIYPRQTITLPAPKGLDLPRWNQKCKFNDAFVVTIPNGRLMTSCCYPVTPDNKRLLDVEFDCPYAEKTLPSPVCYEKTVASLFWGWNIPHLNINTQNIYGHWFFDILPRFHLLEKSGIPIDHYVIGKLHHPFQYESLKMLGIPMDKLLEVTAPDFHIEARKLVVPAVPFYLGKCPPWTSQYITNGLKHNRKARKKAGYERIYVSREDASARFVINEDEVMQLLTKKGFKKLVTTPMTMQEKIDIFSSADIVIAPFGSANINVAFCEPGTSFIELAPNTFVDDYFWKISCHANVQYYELLCAVEQPPKEPAGIDNIIVDISKLEQYLQMAKI